MEYVGVRHLEFGDLRNRWKKKQKSELGKEDSSQEWNLALKQKGKQNDA
jgi:hypothetical protein